MMDNILIPNWHPLLVHFTVALLGVAAVLFTVLFFIREAELRKRISLVAEWNFWIGAAITVLTLLAGWQAFNTVVHDGPSHVAMIEHRNWACITAAWLSLMAAWLIVGRRMVRNPFNPFFALSALVLLGLLGSTAWHGGELVYRHGLGVMSLPAAEQNHHGNAHAAHDHSALKSESDDVHSPDAAHEQDSGKGGAEAAHSDTGHGEQHYHIKDAPLLEPDQNEHAH
jgi:uncharacterized membrane protein